MSEGHQRPCPNAVPCPFGYNRRADRPGTHHGANGDPKRPGKQTQKGHGLVAIPDDHPPAASSSFGWSDDAHLLHLLH